MIEWSGGLNPSAVAGRLSVTRLTQSNCTGIRASGMPRRTVKKMLTTSPIFEETVKQKRDESYGCVWVGSELTKIADELLSIIVYQSTFFYCFLYCGEIRIG